MAFKIAKTFFLLTLLSFVVAQSGEPLPREIPALPPASLSSTHIHTCRPWQRIRDSVIELIWGPPPSSVGSHSKQRADTTFLSRSLLTRYGGDVVFRFRFNNPDEQRALEEASATLYLDVWEATDQWIDIRISTKVLPMFLDYLPSSLRRSHTPLILDLPRAVSDTLPSLGDHHATQSAWSTSSHIISNQYRATQELFFQDYQPLNVLYSWMRLMTSLFPDITQLVHIGFSNEARPIYGLRLSTFKSDDEEDPKPRNTVLITAGSHAREWISVSTLTYIGHSLITRFGHQETVTKFLNHFDLVLIPTINPDGYTYTWEQDRLWRKTRQQTSLPFCHGIDLDRGFDFAWDGADTHDNPCSESYAGPEPFAAAEAKALASWARNETESNRTNFIGFLDLHSYSQQILYPYSYSCQAFPPSLEDLEEVAVGIAKGFRLTNGHHYGVGSACEGTAIASSGSSPSFRLASARTQKAIQPKMSPSGGSALDWFYHTMNVKYAYQIKLRDTGSYGFLLPKANIVPTGQEGFGAVMALAKYLMGNRGIEIDEAVWDSDLGWNSTSLEHIATDDVHIQDEPEEWSQELRRRRRR